MFLHESMRQLRFAILMDEIMIKYVDAKHILQNNKTLDWFGAEYCVNLYRGCSHGCIYCDSRSSCYQDFEFDLVKPKRNAISILKSELAHKRKRGIIDTGAMSDPYNPLEKDLNLTRDFLHLAEQYDFGVSITTKSLLIERDIDILKSISCKKPVICELTITTAKDELSKKLEPHAPSSSNRFKTLETLSNAGLFAGIVLMPVLPFIEDTTENISAIVELAAAAGASFIYPYFGVTLRHNQREYFYNKLATLFPHRGYVNLYKEIYGESYECVSKNLQEIEYVFAEKCEKHNILHKMDDIVSSYKSNYTSQQLTLFDLWN